MYRITSVRKTDHGRSLLIEFSVDVEGKYAYLLGDFNAFNEGGFRMRRERNAWRATVELPEGIWHYAYSIDGRYTLDKDNTERYTRKSYNFSKETNVCTALGEEYARPFHCSSMIFPLADKREVRLRTVKAREVFLLFGNKNRIRMERFACDDPFEHYRALIPLKDGERYSFEVDGNPYGDFEVPGEREDSMGWLYETVFYQIMPCRFSGEDLNSGTLKGLLEHVGHIRALGANALYLTPIFSSDTYHGYDIKDYYSIDPRLGNEDDLVALAKEMRVMLDGVFHHTSRAHPFFRDLLSRGGESDYADFYRPLGFPVKKYECFPKAKNMPRLNHENEKVYEFVRDVVRHWNERGVSAWRMDVAHGVPPPFWERLKTDVPDGYVIGEVMDDARAYLKGFDGVMNYCLYDAVLGFFVDGNSAETFLGDLQRISARYYEKEYFMYNFLDNHDISRFLGLVESRRKYACALAFLFTYKGLPSLFYGDEIGMRKKKRRNEEQREQMVWDEGRWDTKVLGLTRELISLRRNRIALQRGTFEPMLFEGKRILYIRRYGEEKLLVGINYSRERTEWPLKGKLLSGRDDGGGYSFFVSAIHD
jgi:glycosidase